MFSIFLVFIVTLLRLVSSSSYDRINGFPSLFDIVSGVIKFEIEMFSFGLSNQICSVYFGKF